MENYESVKQAVAEYLQGSNNEELSVNVTNTPDEEDLTSVDGLLKFKDRASGDGMGYVILRKDKTIAEQMVSTNTIYEIRYIFDLNGSTLTVPVNSVLKFEGGVLKNGTISLSDTIIDNGVNGLSNIVISGTVKDSTVFFDWFSPTKSTINEYINRTSKNSVNAAILNSIIANTSIKNVVFGDGIYLFNDKIQINSITSNFRLTGNGIKSTCLFFPTSKGFYFYSGDLSLGRFDNFTIHSKYECFDFRHENSNARFNAVHDSVFSDMEMLTTDGEYCFGATKDFNHFLYHNKFEKIGVHGANSCFARCSGLGSVFYGIYDLYSDFSGTRLTVPTRTIFMACPNVILKNSNFTYNGLNHIYVFEGNTDDQSQSANLYVEGCNLESITKEYVLTTSAYVSMRIEFENCSFTANRADMTQEGIQEGAYHLSVSRLVSLKGFPNSIYNDRDGFGYPATIKYPSLGYGETKHTDYTLDAEDSNLKYKIMGKRVDSNPEQVTFTGEKYVYGNIDDYTSAQHTATSYNLSKAVKYNLNPGSETIFGEIGSIPTFVELYNATKENNTFILPTYNKFLTGWGAYVPNGKPITIRNTGKYLIKITDKLRTVSLLPFCQITWFLNNQFSAEKQTLSLLGQTSIINIEKGDIHGEQICIAANSGVYASAPRGSGKYYDEMGYDSYSPLEPYSSLINHNGYIYKCVAKGTTASTAPVYSTEVNDIITDGSAEFVCVGKAAVLVLTKGTSAQRPVLDNSLYGIEYYDTTLNKTVLWNGSEWVNKDGSSLKNIGTSAERPITNRTIGFTYKDTTLGKLIIWDGISWLNMNGTTLS